MTTDDMITAIQSAGLPDKLSSDLINEFITICTDVKTVTIGRATPGKFVETVVQILQYLESGMYDTNPKVDEYLRNLESRSTTLSDDLKITAARVLRAMYTLRNKRNIAHKGLVDPNIYDLRYIHSSAQWVLSEIARNVLTTDMATAGKLIENIQIPIHLLVEDFRDNRLVLGNYSAYEELIILLYHYYPEWISITQIRKDMARRAYKTIYGVIKMAYKNKLIEGDKKRGYKLSLTGYQKAIELAKNKK